MSTAKTSSKAKKGDLGFVADLVKAGQGGGEPAQPAEQAPKSAAAATNADAATEEPTVKFSSRLTPTNDLHMERVTYWMPGNVGKVQKVLNRALREYFAKHPDALRPTEDEPGYQP